MKRWLYKIWYHLILWIDLYLQTGNFLDSERKLQISLVNTMIGRTNSNYSPKWNMGKNKKENSRTSVIFQFPVWGFGLCSVAIISLSGLFGGVFWPLINSSFYNHMMHILIGLAVGSLSATSIFQLIPKVCMYKQCEYSEIKLI